jgi:hypothetical protein
MTSLILLYVPPVAPPSRPLSGGRLARRAEGEASLGHSFSFVPLGLLNFHLAW